nr:ribosomal protein L2 [Klebsormidium dissectum]WKT07700.1 ribosomal protein L2 [Klebsormidium sp. SEV1-VF17pt]
MKVVSRKLRLLRSKAQRNYVWEWERHNWKPGPQRRLVSGQHRKNGRNNRGVITSRYRGGGHKRRYRHIEFQRKQMEIIGLVATTEYDPNRSAPICLVHYENGHKSYVLGCRGLRRGDHLITSPNAPIEAGNALPLKSIPLGTAVHNVELQPGRGGQIARAAGALALLIAKEGLFAALRMPSGEVRLVPQSCYAIIGQVSWHPNRALPAKKAGWKRWIGRRPRVRGAAMNPVDHPHGGGEGRAPVGRKRPLTPWGLPALGRRTRDRHKQSNILILRRRKSGKSVL